MRNWWVAVLVGLLRIGNVSAQNSSFTDPAVAEKLGVTVRQLHSLRAASGLNNERLLGLTPIQLQAFLADLQHPGIDLHAEAQNFEALRMMDEHGRIPPDGLINALEHRRHNLQEADLFPVPPDPSGQVPSFGTPGPLFAGIQNTNWNWLGPGNIGGRVRSILVHPTLAGVLWCGGVDGGVWKSTNNGVAWFPLNDFMANLAIACLTMDPTNANTIYAGTGEPAHNGDAIRGAGIFKTTDGGTTWTQLPSTANSSFLYVGRIAIDPNNGQILLAATRNGVFRTTDGGATWTQRNSTETMDLAFHPSDSSQALSAGYGGGVMYSTDGGVTWTPATGLPASGRVEMAYAGSMPSVVYASANNNGGEIYVSGDGGHSFSLRNTGSSYLGSQGWYDNVIWIDPTTTNVLIVGGIDLWRSTNGGATLAPISEWQIAPSSAHADHHAIVNVPGYDGVNVRTVYFGNDGGVYRANDVYTVTQTSGWTSLNNNLGITQFYGAAGNSNSMVIVGGTQDNGTLRDGGNPQGVTTMFGGDGGFCAADPTDPNYFYGEYVYLKIHRSANGGSSSSYIYTGIADATNNAANFIAPFILDPNNPNTMLAGGLSLWRSLNVKAGVPSWASIKNSTGQKISAIAVALGTSDIIWVGHNNGDVYYTTNGTSAAPTWYQRNLGTPNLPARYCERIAISPVDPNRVYVTFGGYNSGNVWRTTDSGVTWANITGNLPAAPVNSIVIAPADTNTLYVGTEVGVYGTSNEGANWSTGNDGPANVSIDELFWVGNKLVAATHGRGLYYIVPALGGASPVPVAANISGGNGNGSVDPNECNQLFLSVQNAGGGSATNCSAWVTCAVPGVTIIQGASSYPNLAPTAFGTNTIPFQVSTAPSLTCGTAIPLTLYFAYNGTTNVMNFSLPSGSGSYAIVQSTGAAIVAGVTDIGNHFDDGTTMIPLPFSFTLYGQSFTNATLSSNGNLQFQSSDPQYANPCPLPYSGFSYAIMPLWDDLRTDLGVGSGIFISTNGIAPNRIFNIEWRAIYYASQASVNFEIRLYEGQSRFDVIYGILNDNGSSATVGIQRDASTYLMFQCNGSALSPGLQLTFNQSCVDGGGQCSSAPTANFTAAPTTGPVPLTVYFTNLSINASGYEWDFGDGNGSQSASPSHTYLAAGTYGVSLTATNSNGTNVLLLANYITVTNVPPQIGTPPHDKTVSQGTDATFTVTASGTPPLAYEWRFGGAPISGATDSTYTRSAAQCADAGAFDVVVTNIAGGTTSTVAHLTVIAPPDILSGPSNLTVTLGSPAQLSVMASNDCGGGLSYQWQQNGTVLPGATGSVLSFASAQISNAGPYLVIVSDLAASVTSLVATLTVVTPAQLVVTPSTPDFGIILTGATAQASFVVSNSGGLPLSGTASINGGPFQFVNAGAANLQLPATTGTNLAISFNPQTSGSFSNTISFVTSGGNLIRSLFGKAVDSFAPVILIAPQVPGEFIFYFETIPGKTYWIEFNSALDGSPWSTQGSVAGDGTTQYVTNSISPGQKYFRLRVQ